MFLGVLIQVMFQWNGTAWTRIGENGCIKPNGTEPEKYFGIPKCNFPEQN